MPPIAIERLRDALGAALIIREAVRDHSFEQYVADEWFRSANERQLEIIGVAVGYAHENYRNVVEAPDVEWCKCHQ